MDAVIGLAPHANRLARPNFSDQTLDDDAVEVDGLLNRFLYLASDRSLVIRRHRIFSLVVVAS
jgi:hypothetical protein